MSPPPAWDSGISKHNGAPGGAGRLWPSLVGFGGRAPGAQGAAVQRPCLLSSPQTVPWTMACTPNHGERGCGTRGSSCVQESGRPERWGERRGENTGWEPAARVTNSSSHGEKAARRQEVCLLLTSKPHFSR